MQKQSYSGTFLRTPLKKESKTPLITPWGWKPLASNEQNPSLSKHSFIVEEINILPHLTKGFRFTF